MYAFLLLCAILVILFLTVILFPMLGGGATQPLVFNHRIHKESGMECEDCHIYFKKSAFSGRPDLDTCSSCHEELLGESQAEKELLDYIKSGREIEWQRLYILPEDVYFSHKRHVVSGNIDCSTCHGDIGESPRPPSKPLKLTMERCMRCHEEKQANNDCIACHR